MAAIADHVATLTLKLDGQPLEERYAQRVIEVRVDDNRYLPDAFLIRISDPRPFSHTLDTEASPLRLGAKVEIAVSSPDSELEQVLLRGVIMALEPEFGAAVTLAVRGYDLSQGLNRARKTRTFEQMSVRDVVGKLAQDHSLTPKVTASQAGQQLAFWQQNEETDLAALWRLARRVGAEVVVDDTTLEFRDGPAPAPPIRLQWGAVANDAATLRSFRPRVTTAQQVGSVTVGGWDPKARQSIVGEGAVGELSSSIGLDRDQAVSSFPGASDEVLRISDRPSGSTEEAKAIASSVITQIADGYLEAEGTVAGDPRLRAGASVQVAGVGSDFSGTYVASSTTHLYRGSKGYVTIFRVSGRQPRGLVDLLTPSTPRDWGQGVVVGTVTNANDPDGLGRVRLKFPSLGGDTESAWARIVGPGAGARRGLLWTPVVDDEVLVAFEHDDVRFPYVLGALWNGKAKPEALVTQDGSLAIRSEHHITVESVEDLTAKVTGGSVLVETTDGSGTITHKLASGGEYVVDSGGKVTVKGAQTISIEGQADVKIKGMTMTIEAQQLSLKAQTISIEGQGQLSLSSSGVVQVSGAQIMLG